MEDRTATFFYLIMLKFNIFLLGKEFAIKTNDFTPKLDIPNGKQTWGSLVQKDSNIEDLRDKIYSFINSNIFKNSITYKYITLLEKFEVKLDEFGRTQEVKFIDNIIYYTVYDELALKREEQLKKIGI